MEKDHSPDNGMEAGGIASMGKVFIVGTLDEIGSGIGSIPQLNKRIRNNEPKSKVIQRHRIGFFITFFQGSVRQKNPIAHLLRVAFRLTNSCGGPQDVWSADCRYDLR